MIGESIVQARKWYKLYYLLLFSISLFHISSPSHICYHSTSLNSNRKCEIHWKWNRRIQRWNCKWSSILLSRWNNTIWIRWIFVGLWSLQSQDQKDYIWRYISTVAISLHIFTVNLICFRWQNQCSDHCWATNFKQQHFIEMWYGNSTCHLFGQQNQHLLFHNRYKCIQILLFSIKKRVKAINRMRCVLYWCGGENDESRCYDTSTHSVGENLYSCWFGNTPKVVFFLY